MRDTTAPFRADMVGSLLRTAQLKEARAKRAAGEITPAELRGIEDEDQEDHRQAAGDGTAARHRW